MPLYLPNIVRCCLINVIIQPSVNGERTEMADFTGLSRIVTPFSLKMTPFNIHFFLRLSIFTSHLNELFLNPYEPSLKTFFL